jgi:O-antigen/teichoic acid export membrane protein
MSLGEYFKIIRKSELVINTSVLITGTAMAQLIPVLLQPLLRRPFAPEIFGAYSVYLSLLGILVIISSFRYELAIMLPKKEKDAANLLFLSLIINFIFNLVLFILISLWKEKLSYFLNLPGKFGYYLYLVPVGTFLFGSYQSINYWLLRQKQFAALSINKFTRRGFEGAVQLGTKYLGMTHFLIYGDLLGHLSNLISGIYQSIRSGLKMDLFSRIRINYLARKYLDYPKYSLVPALMSAGSTLLPVIFINKFYSLENAGYLDLSRMLLSLPLALISLSVSSVLMQKISERFRNGESIFHDLSFILILISVIGVFEIVIIMFFGVGLFKLIFGDQWGFSGEISKYLVWSYAINFVVNSFVSIFISMNKIRLLSFWQFFYFMSILTLLLFKEKPFLDFIKIYVGIEIVCATVITLFMISIVLKYEDSLKHLKCR